MFSVEVHDQPVVSNSELVGFKRRQSAEIALRVSRDGFEFGNDTEPGAFLQLAKPVGRQLRELDLKRQDLALGLQFP